MISTYFVVQKNRQVKAVMKAYGTSGKEVERTSYHRKHCHEKSSKAG